jgi:hypothetical protein
MLKLRCGELQTGLVTQNIINNKYEKIIKTGRFRH